MLLNSGSVINEGGVNGVSALYMAVHEGHYAVAEFLYQHGGDVANGFIDTDNDYHGADSFFYKPDNDRSPLYHAARFAKQHFISLLLSDPERDGGPGWRLEKALEQLANSNKMNKQNGVARCVKLLVDAGVDMDAPGIDGACAMQTAILNWNEEMVETLLKNVSVLIFLFLSIHTFTFARCFTVTGTLEVLL